MSTAAISTPAKLPGRLLLLLALSGLLLTAGDFLRRGRNAWQAAGIAPGVTITSGCEEESLFALWRAGHRQPVYLDTAHPPFAAAYFNWLFYATYSVPFRSARPPADATDFIRASRLLTATGALVGAVLLSGFFLRLLPTQRGVALVIGCFVFLGPLVGWWAHTARPDVWCLVFESAAIVTLLVWHRTKPWPATLGCTVLFFVAWSLKQTYVIGPAAAVLYLLARRRWAHAAALAGATAALWCAAFVLLGPAYRASQIQAGTTVAFYLATGWSNLLDTGRKAAPLWLLAGAALLSVTRFKPADATPSLTRDARLFGLLGVVAALPLTFMAACKLGAASNYYFTVTVMLALAGVGALALHPSRWLPAAAGALIIALQLVLLRGQTGLQPQWDELAQRWGTFQKLPEPRFSFDNRLNLPWLNPHSPPFVLAYYYELDRLAGKSYEAGGVAGLIERGYFAALLLDPATTDSAYGGKLSRYIRGETVGNLTVFRRATPSSSP